LHYLCLDRKTFDKLNALNLGNIKAYDVEDVVYGDETAAKIKSTDRWYFCMSMASYFSKKVMDLTNLPVMYVDSDIYFHLSANEMCENFDGKDIAIFRHRQFPLEHQRPEGWFNVGVVFFRNTKFGKNVLNWWQDAVINRKYPELSTCGDQKYLDRFPDLCPEECLFIDGDVGHGAPWQWQLYDLSDFKESGKIVYNGKSQLLFFTHFSQFSYDSAKKTYVPSTMHHQYTSPEVYEQNSSLREIYSDYFRKIIETERVYGI
jgi:hypothetical protein